MYDRKVWEATPGHTLLHRLDVRTKLLLLISFSIGSLLIDSSRSLFILLCATLAMHAVAQASLERWKILALFILLGIWGSMASQSLFYNQEPRSIVACLLAPTTPVIGKLTGGVFIYREGLEYGAIQALRSSIMISLGLLLTWTSDPRKILRSFMAWKMPYELAFMLITSIRFLPVIFQETSVVITAQKLRGFKPFRSFLPKRLIQTAFQTLFPILARTLRRAAILAASVESRGFAREFHYLTLENWPKKEQAFSWLLLCSASAIALLKIMDFMQFNGLLYIPAWRNLYDMMKVWM